MLGTEHDSLLGSRIEAFLSFTLCRYSDLDLAEKIVK